MSDDRLNRAMAAATPPRDAAFTLSVLRAAEDARYRRDRVRRMAIGAALAFDASLLLILGGYAINADPTQAMLGVGVVILSAALLTTTRAAARWAGR